jgi:uncharacterized protein YjeT (DUF2065 family)
MELAVERLTALSMIIIGLSHIAAPRAWVTLFTTIRSQGDAGGLLNAFIHLPLGLVIVAFHPVWSGPALLVTLLGCAWTLKGALYLLWPQLAEKSMARVSPEQTWHFSIAGVFSVLIGLAVGWIALGQPGV